MSTALGFSDDDNDETVDLFGGLNANDIADDPYDVPDDTYEVACKDAKIGRSKSGKLGLTIIWTITGGNEAILGRGTTEWFQVGPFDNAPGTSEYDAEVSRRSWLKRRLVSMGVPDSKMGSSFDPSDLIGTTGIMKTKKKTSKGGQENVTVQSFVLKDTDTGGISF